MLMMTERNIQRFKKHGLRVAVGFLRLSLFVALTFVVLYPLFAKVAASIMTVGDVHDMSVRYIPRNPTLTHYSDLWKQLKMASVFPLTIQFVFLVSFLQTLSATVAGYGMARYRIKLNGALFAVAILSLLIPPDLILIPLYGNFRYFDLFGLISLFNGGQPVSLINTQWPFILLGVTCTGYRCGLYILLMCQYFRGMPKELEEAAYIDGAGAAYTFYRIMLPGARIMMITVFLFGFVWVWLDTKFITTLLPDYPLLVSEVQRISALSLDASANVVLRNLRVSAGIVYLIIPLVILYIFTQRYFVQSIERSGLVG